MKFITTLMGLLMISTLSHSALADDNEKDCPVGLVSGLTLDEEFGPGTADVTRCLESQKMVKVVYNVNKSCSGPNCSRPYALGNIMNAIKDYEITHGMKQGEDYELVAIFYAGGSELVLKGNPYEGLLLDLMSRGVKAYFCQNTSRNKGIVLADLIEGVEYVTAGVTAVADYQLNGYAVVTPNP